MYCHKCGKEIRDDDAFCPYCGARIADAPTPSVPKVEESGATTMIDPPASQKKYILVFISVLAIALAVAYIYYNKIIPEREWRSNYNLVFDHLAEGYDKSETLPLLSGQAALDLVEINAWSGAMVSKKDTAEIYLKRLKNNILKGKESEYKAISNMYDKYSAYIEIRTDFQNMTNPLYNSSLEQAKKKYLEAAKKAESYYTNSY